MSFLNELASSIRGLGKAISLSLELIKKIAYTNERVNIIGWILFIIIVITIIELITGMLFESDFEEEEE